MTCDQLTPAHRQAQEARDVIVIVLTQRLWETPQPPPVLTEIQAAAYAALR
jgi:hypothetical protein